MMSLDVRARVVALLRCTADRGAYALIGATAARLGESPHVYRRAILEYARTRKRKRWPDPHRVYTLLETAQRIEDGIRDAV